MRVGPLPSAIRIPPATLRVALAQVNTTVGDLEGNARLATEWVAKAKAAGADIVAFPELTITGYPPEDLLLLGNFPNLKKKSDLSD